MLPRPAALLFDMDGLMIDSEPLWRQAEVRVFAPLGVQLSEADLEHTMGWRIDQVVLHWLRERPWTGPGVEQVAQDIVTQVAAEVQASGVLLPGVREALQAGSAAGLPMALASSSPRLLIDAVVAHFQLAPHFQFVHSAEDEPRGKPHPAVFLTAAAALDVAPERCWIIEDSITGVIAAKAAAATCIAVPGALTRGDPRFVLADRVLGSLEELPGLLRAYQDS